MSGRVRSTNRSAGLLVGRAHLSGTAETLVGGDPGVPMSQLLETPVEVLHQVWFQLELIEGFYLYCWFAA
jgi:hypothetical protein